MPPGPHPKPYPRPKPKPNPTPNPTPKPNQACPATFFHVALDCPGYGGSGGNPNPNPNHNPSPNHNPNQVMPRLAVEASWGWEKQVPTFRP